MTQGGDAVIYVDENRKEHNALVLFVHEMGGDREPMLNIVFTDEDPNKHDSYGRQIARESSVSPWTDNDKGRYWKKK